MWLKDQLENTGKEIVTSDLEKGGWNVVETPKDTEGKVTPKKDGSKNFAIDSKFAETRDDNLDLSKGASIPNNVPTLNLKERTTSIDS